MSLPFSEYKPTSRFEEMAPTPLGQAMWACVSSEDKIGAMIEAIEKGETPLLPLDSELHTKFSSLIEESEFRSDDLRVMCMNMMKQILEKRGYQHVACCLVPNGEFVRSAGVFEKGEI